MGTLIEQKKQELEQRKEDVRKVELFKLIISHFAGIVYAIAELYLGYKPDLKK